MKELNVLSPFGGIECAYEALKQLDIKVNKYYSSEIDEKSMEVASKNHPDIIHLGDVTAWQSWNIKFNEIGFVPAGSPCQGLSLAGKRKGFNDPRSALFFTYVDLLNHIKSVNPNVLFLYENVKPKNKEDIDIITKLLGVEPIIINSSLVSAQNRVRYYWTNIPNITIPEDRGITLDSIIPGALGCGERGVKKDYKDKNEKYKYPLTIRKDGKANCVTTTKGNTGMYLLGNTKIRNSIELAEQLQTLPIGYTDVKGITKTQRYKMVGNGWTIEVVKWILKNLL